MHGCCCCCCCQPGSATQGWLIGAGLSRGRRCCCSVAVGRGPARAPCCLGYWLGGSPAVGVLPKHAGARGQGALAVAVGWLHLRCCARTFTRLLLLARRGWSTRRACMAAASCRLWAAWVVVHPHTHGLQGRRADWQPCSGCSGEGAACQGPLLWAAWVVMAPAEPSKAVAWALAGVCVQAGW